MKYFTIDNGKYLFKGEAGSSFNIEGVSAVEIEENLYNVYAEENEAKRVEHEQELAKEDELAAGQYDLAQQQKAAAATELKNATGLSDESIHALFGVVLVGAPV